MRGDLRGEEIPVTTQLHQARARRAVLAQQREVRRALARRLDDGEDPSQHGQLGAALRDVREQRRQQGLQALAPGLIELAHQGRGAQLQQQARDFRAVCETGARSEEHTSELQSRSDLVCRLLLEKKKKKRITVRMTAM